MKHFHFTNFRFVFLVLLSLLILHSHTFTPAQTPARQAAEVKIDAKIFDRYVGQYQDAVNLPDIIFSFSREGASQLIFQHRKKLAKLLAQFYGFRSSAARFRFIEVIRIAADFDFNINTKI
jgi:hypothetical protein